jgi:hypothetical protein
MTTDYNTGFDEDNAVEYIRTSLPDDIKEKYDDDELLYIVDIIWDYYESKGMLSLDFDVDEDEEQEGDDDLLNVDDLVAFVKKELRKDAECNIESSDVKYIVKGELEYEESLEAPI